ncbi:hypothetical protein [Pontibacter harenae]|uniref:hypothetical protein n=1 Tax=Pontibacter harenae TaxID=2894083 RepID=UPI001E5AC66E|nr:hypothetical protein [Pontibacter harenae]MCC9166993.1 hypothetical protein [Pontibacter harenae]
MDNLVRDGAGCLVYALVRNYTRDSMYIPLALWQKELAHDYVITLDVKPDLRNYSR